jgi:hypothetical protein
MADNDGAGDKEDVLFRYYAQQWEQVRHNESLRSSFTLQLLIIAAGAVAGYFNAAAVPEIRLGLACLIVLVGAIGFGVALAQEKAVQIHIERARKARAKIKVIDEIAGAVRGFYPLDRYYLLLNVLVSLFGLVLAFYAFRR